MRKLLLLILGIFIYSTMSAESDTLWLKGIFYLDGSYISVGIKNGVIVDVSRIKGDPGIPQIYIGPGLIDLQINGFMGVDFSDPNLSPADVRRACTELLKAGVTTFLPTITTNERSKLLNSFTRLSEALKDENIQLSVPGFHLEGPYISPVAGFRGAHLEKYIRTPDWNEFLSFQKAAHGKIRIITLAPEVNGSLSFIKKCSESGVIVSLGHHNGSAEIIRQAIDSGASMCTHLGNGCANLIDRHNNPLWPQLADDRLSATIIADGFHLNKDEVNCFYRMKGLDHTILISDALDLAGMPPGEYIRGERKVLLTREVVKFPAENVLAGAATPVSTGVSNIMKFTGCSLGYAIQMASTNAARILGLKNLGEIKEGYRADLILFTIEEGRIIIQKTILAGKEVYSKKQ